MKNTRWIFVGALAITATLFTACNRTGNGNNPLAPCNGASCGAAATSPYGYSPYGYGNPYYTANQKVGYFSQSANAIYFGLPPANSYMTFGSGWSSLLKEAMGVCDQASLYGGYNAGLSSCSTWNQGAGDVVFFVNGGSTGNTVDLFIRAFPQINGGSWYNVSIPDPLQLIGAVFGISMPTTPQGWFNPLKVSATIYPVNNSQGFEIRANGPSLSQGYNKLIQLQVANGKTEDAYFDFKLYYNGLQNLAAQGRMYRCQTSNCGLTGYY